MNEHEWKECGVRFWRCRLYGSSVISNCMPTDDGGFIRAGVHGHSYKYKIYSNCDYEITRRVHES